uniref:Uncharacterized protein n=1 Tax=viral metagenome TaxID=1070528 RepID=A0A6C0I4I7_9ZZZZ
MATKSESSAQIISGVNMNPDTDTKYAKVKVNNSGGKSVGILNAATNTVLNVQTPLMLTWGVNENTDKKTGEVQSYTMALQFPSDEYKTLQVNKFFANMQQFEAKIKRDAIANSKEWFGKAMSAEVINAIFTPMLYYSKNPQTGEPDLSKNPTLKVKLPFYDGEWKGIEIYDTENNTLFPGNSDGKTPKDIILKGSDVSLIMTCGGLWFAGGAFGVTWRLFQAVLKPKASLRGKCHIVLDEDEQKRIAAPSKTTQQHASHDDDDCVPSSSAAHEVDVEDSESEEEEEPALIQRQMSSAPPAAAAAAAAATAPKKIVAKKK